MDELRATIRAGFAHLAKGEWTEAVRHLSAAIRRQPGDVRVVRALATAHLRAGDVPAARRVLGDFTLAYPLSAEGWRLAGQLEWKVGRRDEAARVIAGGLERLPGSAALHRQMAVFLGAMGDVDASAPHADESGDEAVARYVAAARGDVAEVGRVAARAKRRRETPCTDWLDRVAQEPAVLDALLRVADGRRDFIRFHELAARVALLVAAQPGHADRHAALARVRLMAGDVVGAREAAEQALAINPYYADARRVRAEITGAGNAERSTRWRAAA